MGEIAEMMLDGTMCEGCGEWLHDGEDGPGFPGLCASCARVRGVAATTKRPWVPSGRPPEAKCRVCGKRCRSVDGLAMHARDKHQASEI